MPKVIKICAFLFTLTTTILGFPLWQDSVLPISGSQTLQPIATDGVMFLGTSNVTSITTAPQTHLHTLPHYSTHSLYLTALNPGSASNPQQGIPHPSFLISLVSPSSQERQRSSTCLTQPLSHWIHLTHPCSISWLSRPKWATSLDYPADSLFNFKNNQTTTRLR
jgi:hypothetical protein